ncbi:RNA polymerase sigma factor [Lysobacter koreensis]|uniref:RNA polymerase sigma factor n=1 Tax=Lysobacter koreensis TaxID=266122 RepID=A0ABW2YPQ3_9GAMM
MNAETIEGLIHHELPAAADGDRHAYSRIVAACQNAVTGLALAIVRDVPASEDIAQEAFLNAWNNLRRLQNPTSFLPWLREITRNLARDHLRNARRFAREVADADEVIAAVADPGPGPAEHLIEHERQHAAAELISALPDDSREVLLLYYREGQSSQQVAALLGLSDAAVRKRLSRARATVRSELLARFSAFACDSAPSAAFTAMVATALGVASPTATAAIAVSALGAGAVGSGVGKLGAGGVGAGVSAGVAGGAAGGGFSYLVDAAMRYDVVLVASLAGVLASYLGGRYLLRFAGNERERAAINRFVRNITAITAVFCVGAAALVVLTRGWIPITAFAIASLAVLNYQYLVPLPRIMAPCFARAARRSGAYQPPRMYRYCFGSSAVWISSVFALAGLLHALAEAGRF